MKKRSCYFLSLFICSAGVFLPLDEVTEAASVTIRAEDIKTGNDVRVSIRIYKIDKEGNEGDKPVAEFEGSEIMTLAPGNYIADFGVWDLGNECFAAINFADFGIWNVGNECLTTINFEKKFVVKKSTNAQQVKALYKQRGLISVDAKDTKGRSLEGLGIKARVSAKKGTWNRIFMTPFQRCNSPSNYSLIFPKKNGFYTIKTPETGKKTVRLKNGNIKSVTAIYSSFTDNGDGTITDFETTLLWQKKDDDKKRDWDNAYSYCNGLILAGTGWRLPSKVELLGIIHTGREDPSIDTTYFPTTKSSLYWSSSSTAADTSGKSSAYTVDFNTGGDIPMISNEPNNYVRCVRDGELHIR